MKFIDLTMMPFKPFMPAIACANMNTRVQADRNTQTTDDDNDDSMAQTCLCMSLLTV